MANLSLQFLVVPPRLKHTATCVILHGLGDTGAGWEPVARMLQANAALGHIKWILPHAMAPVTLNFGMKMPSWYDIVSLTDIPAGAEDERGMLASSRSINELISSELTATPDVGESRIVLGGFSQGAAMTFVTGLTTERKLAGLFTLSGYLPLRTKIGNMLSNHAKELPIFIGHGTADHVVAFKFGERSFEFLKDTLGFAVVESSKMNQIAGPGVRFERYDGLGHGADPEEIDHLGEWLKAVIPQ